MHERIKSEIKSSFEYLCSHDKHFWDTEVQMTLAHLVNETISEDLYEQIQLSHMDKECMKFAKQTVFSIAN